MEIFVFFFSCLLTEELWVWRMTLFIPRMLEVKVLWQTLGLNYGDHGTAKIFLCLMLVLQLAPLKSMAVKLTTCLRCQSHNESCHSYTHVNKFTNANFTIKFSTFPHMHSTACMYFIAERRPCILKSWFLFNYSAKFIWGSHYSIYLTIPSPYIWVWSVSWKLCYKGIPPLPYILTMRRRPCFFSIYYLLIAHS